MLRPNFLSAGVLNPVHPPVPEPTIMFELYDLAFRLHEKQKHIQSYNDGATHDFFVPVDEFC